MRGIFLPPDASKARIKAAENARKNRAEIVRELSWGRVSRRDLIRMGLFTSAGLLAPIRGLNPFVSSAFADGGMPRSPLFGCQPFTQPMPRFDVLARNPNAMSFLNPTPTAEANQTRQALNPAFGLGPDATGPIEGRPFHPEWDHQKFKDFLPQIAVQATQAPARTNFVYNPQVSTAQLNLLDIDPAQAIPLQFHPNMPVQKPNSVWTFNGTIPPKLVLGRYGEPILFRHRNGLPFNVRDNGGFGRHTISTHEHNGHHGAENDGFTGAFFFPGQFYDYHWPIVLAGIFSVNTGATDPRASAPDNGDGLKYVPGDWRETMSTHWFHDHMFSYTSQNVYKGNAAMFNIYSGLDRGAEDIREDLVFPDGTRGSVNLQLPSGNSKYTGKGWGNLDYDVNLMLADKAFDRDGQLFMDIFAFDGFVGDVMTVNLAYMPYMNVERRKYRFRILNASVARFFKLALADASGVPQQITQIANDGNLLPHPVALFELDEQGIAERYDIVIDFSRYRRGDKLHLVNLADHADPVDGKLKGTRPIRDLTVAQALSGISLDPCVGRILEFRVVAEPAYADESRVPETLIPNPILPAFVSRVRTFEFGRDAIRERVTEPDGRVVDVGAEGPWGISTNGGLTLDADYGRISAAPAFGSREVWHLVNDGGGWDHPIHIHFEEGQILERNGKASNVSAAESGRKDVYRLHPGGSLTITMQFRDWGGMFMEHCHNTTHEDNAMLLRWEINDAGGAFLKPLPTPIAKPTGVDFEDPFEIIP